MTTTDTFTTAPQQTDGHASAHGRGRTAWHLIRHYLEMVVAMIVGMVALGPLESLVWPGLHDRTDVMVLVMATNMAIAMSGWMWFRRHSWPAIAEMAGAMYLPFLVLLVPYWAGAVSGDAVMTWGHLLMLVAMAVPMVWWRRSEYVH
jgi:flagellar biosynthetic protein FliP